MLRWEAPCAHVGGGVATPDDGIKALLAGADVVQLVSALLRHGPGHIAAMQDALERWLEWQHLDSLTGMIGRASFEASPDPHAMSGPITSAHFRAGRDDLDEAQAVVHHAQQTVRVGRQIDAHDFGRLLQRHIDEARILMGEACCDQHAIAQNIVSRIRFALVSCRIK